MTPFAQIEARLRKLVLVLGVAGTLIAAFLYGIAFGAAFLVGAGGAWLNLRIIEGVANRLSSLAAPRTDGAGESAAKPAVPNGLGLFIQFSALVLGAFGILYFSGFSGKAALWGFFVFPAAVFLEILYELTTLKHGK